MATSSTPTPGLAQPVDSWSVPVPNDDVGCQEWQEREHVAILNETGDLANTHGCFDADDTFHKDLTTPIVDTDAVMLPTGTPISDTSVADGGSREVPHQCQLVTIPKMLQLHHHHRLDRSETLSKQSIVTLVNQRLGLKQTAVTA